MSKIHNNTKRQQIGLIILSVIDVILGILSIVFSAVSVQILALVASGATCIKAIVQSKKVFNLLKELKPTLVKMAIKTVPIMTLKIVRKVHNNNNKEYLVKMKEFLKNLKNNKITLLLSVFEAFLCGSGGAIVIHYDMLNAIPKPYNIVVSVILTVIVYALLVVGTIYLGHDSKAFALIRKLVKQIGGDNAVEVLDVAKEEIDKHLEEEKIKAEKEQAIKDEEERVWQLVQAEEQAEAERIKAAKIAAYRAAHPVGTAETTATEIVIK